MITSNLNSPNVNATGLTSEEANKRLEQYGPNVVEEEKVNRLLVFLKKFWAPIPWMLEASILLEFILGRYLEGTVIAILLVFNAVVSFYQENNAQQALEMLKARLAIQARVLRDSRWQLVPANVLVPGDIIHVRLGDFIPADIRVFEGSMLVDQSALTGESAAVNVNAEGTAYAGSTVKRGEASGEITGTGVNTYFGKTAELVKIAKTENHLEHTIYTIVKYLLTLDIILVAALIIYSFITDLPLKDTIPFSLILLVASVPVALPSTFALATALGAQELAKKGILVTRLNAIEEAAALDVLASDKTGTITKNELSLGKMAAYAPFTEEELLRYAALACDEATQDPIDLAILNAAREKISNLDQYQRLEFIPFDPSTKRSEGVFKQNEGTLRVIKGAATVVSELAPEGPEFDGDMEIYAAQGYRLIAVAAGTGNDLKRVGLLGLLDPPREDSAALVKSLNELGVRVLMITGDSINTAKSVAAQVGITGNASPADKLKEKNISDETLESNIFAGVFPENKFRLVKAFQKRGHIVGMTGDGVNDAPALKQAEVGIAVSSATDVAKAAASAVLTQPGLGEIVDAIQTSRRIYQRMLTYIFNRIMKTFQIVVFLTIGVMLTRSFVITPVLVVLLLFANDFITMSITTDRVSFSQQPDRWHIRTLVWSSLVLSIPILVLFFVIFFYAKHTMHLSLPEIQTLVFLMLVFTGQGTVYMVRERKNFWHSRPSNWLLGSTIIDIIVICFMAWKGILMSPLTPSVIFGTLTLIAGFLFLLDFLKIRIFRYYHVH